MVSAIASHTIEKRTILFITCIRCYVALYMVLTLDLDFQLKLN